MKEENKISEENKKAIIEYHVFHGDTNIRPIRYIYDKTYGKGCVVRHEDKNGKTRSSIGMFMCGGSVDYYTELFSSERENEKELIEEFKRNR